MSLRARLRPAQAAVKANLLPGLVLQGFALVIVLGYFGSDSVRDGLDAVGRSKLRYGFAFSALSTAVFGGLIPYLVLLFGGRIPVDRRLSELLFYVIFWAYKGMEVDLFYRTQAWLFGDQATLAVVATKMLCDQFGYTAFWAAPTQTLAFIWKDAGFSWTGAQARLRRLPFLDRALVILLSNWAVWIPAVAVIYALPTPLQLPLFNLVLCFWCLLLSFLSRQSG